MNCRALLLLAFTIVDEAPEVSARLVRRALGGDRMATRALVQRLLPVVRATVAAHLRRWQGRRATWGDVDDYAQEVWLALLADGGSRLATFDPSRGIPLEKYVCVLAHRECSNRLRSETAQKRGGDRWQASEATLSIVPTPQPSAEARVVAQSAGRALGDWLAEQLPARGLAIFRCLYQDGHDAPETARVVGCSTQVVYNWQHKIRTLARQFAAEHG